MKSGTSWWKGKPRTRSKSSGRPFASIMWIASFMAGAVELPQQPLHVVRIGGAFLGVARVAVARRATGEERALARMRARIGAIGDAVAVHVEIAAELLTGVEVGRGHHLAAVVSLGVVPLQRPAQAMVHADVEVEHDEYRRLQPVGEVEGLGAELKGFSGILREHQHVLGVAVRRVGAGE